MEKGSLAFLADGTPVIVVATGEGEPHDAANVANPDYRPALVGVLEAVEVEQGQLFDKPPADEAEAEQQAGAVH